MTPGGDDAPRAAQAVCVLGCPTTSAAIARRARAAAEAFARGAGELVVACGGRAWGGSVEADHMAEALRASRVPAAVIVRERCSLDTRDNARFAAVLLARRGISRVVLVTCAWHMPRAARLFTATGLEVVEKVGVEPPSPTEMQRLYWRAREAVTSWKDAKRAMRIV